MAVFKVLAKRHKCLVEMDKFLADRNTRLCSDLFRANRVFLATEHIKVMRNGKRPAQVICSFCPVCGKKLTGVS